MKKITKLTVLCLVLVLVLSAVLLTACTKPTADSEGTATIVIGDNVYIVDLSKIENIQSVDSVLDYLHETENIATKYSTSEYGRFWEILGTLAPEGNQWIAVYTSVEKDFLTSEPVSTCNYKNSTLTMSAVGTSSMSIEKDCIILFRLKSYRSTIS